MVDHENADVVQQLAEAPGWLGDALAADRGVATDAAGEWGVGEIIPHLRASDAILSTRIFQVLVRDGLPLPGFDERAWGDLYVAGAIPLDDQVVHYTLRRAELVAVLRALTPEQWTKSGEHEEAGTLTVIDICRSIANRESEHRAQLDRIVGGDA